MMLFHFSQETVEELASDALALRSRVNGDREVTHDVSEDLEVAAIRVQLAGQSCHSRQLGDEDNPARQAVRHETIHVVARDLGRRTGKATRGRTDILV